VGISARQAPKAENGFSMLKAKRKALAQSTQRKQGTQSNRNRGQSKKARKKPTK
jgi:ribosomal protein L4